MADSPNPDSNQDGANNAGSDQNAGMVPIERLNQALERNRTLEAQLAAQGSQQNQQTAQPTQPRVYSRTELQAAVDAGTITEAQMESQLDRQQEDRARQIATEAAQGVITSTSHQSIINEYKNKIPALNDPTSQEYQQVAREFQAQRALGHPESLATEVSALRVVYGDINVLKSAGEAAPAETHQETDGGGGAPSQPSGPGPDKDMPQRMRNHYDHQIRSGILKDWNQANKQWGYRNKHAGRLRISDA